MSESFSTSSVWQSNMDYGRSRILEEGNSKMDTLDFELWHACAGPLTSLPPLESVVVYWPQGHIEQVVACTSDKINGDVLKPYKLPSKIICRLNKIDLKADPQTDEVYAQMDLTPLEESGISSSMKEPPPPPAQKNTHMFCKTLTASDTSTHGGFSVPRRAAELCLPLLDYTMNPPCQELVAKDLHGAEWKFRHIYRGHPRRHLLTTGWSVFVSSKRLVAGDSVLFLRGENGQLRIGVRRATMQHVNVRSPFFCSMNLHLGVIAAASHAAINTLRFSVIYNPRTSPSEFVIPYHKYVKAESNIPTVGSRFKMRFESEESAERRCTGTITGVGVADPKDWADSLWRSVKVDWDESAASERHERVSPWEIEPFVPVSTLPPPPSVGPRQPKRRPPTLVTDSSPLGTSQSALDPFQSNKLARILQVHDHRNVGLSFGDEEEGDVTSSRTPSWTVKREPQRPGPQNWFRSTDNSPVEDVLGNLQGGAQRQDYVGLLNLDSSKQNVEREKHQLRLCVQKLRDQHKEISCYDHMSATSLQLSPQISAGSHIIDNGALQLSVNSGNIEQPSSNSLTSIQWNGGMGPPTHLSGASLTLREPSTSMPYWLTTPRTSLPSSGTATASHPGVGKGVLLPSTLSNNKPFLNDCPSQNLPFGQRDLPEQEQFSNAAPPQEQHCKLFGFDLTDMSAPVMASAPSRCEDSEVSIPWPEPDHSSGDQHATTKLSSGDSQGHAQTGPVRSGTKVYQQGKFGRTIDLKKCESYVQLKRMLATLFNLEGHLDDPSKGWQLVYTDHENDMLLVGDDPWEEFCSCVRSLKIFSPEEVAAHVLGKHASSRGEEGD